MMSKVFKQIFIFLAIFKELTEIHGVPLCSENIPAPVCLTDSKDPHDFSEFKFQLKTTIGVMDIVQVNEIDKSITLYVYMLLEWNDTAYSINDGNITWQEVPLSSYNEIRRPSLMFLNAFDVQKISLFGSDRFNYFWIYTENQTSFEYAEYLQVTLGCNFEFNNFPFDRHDCKMEFFCPSYDEPMLEFKEIHLEDSHTGVEVPMNESFDLLNERIPFHANVRILLDTEPKTIGGYSFSTAGIQFKFKRTKFELLMSGYFIPTGMFALFSLMSFLISIENVSKKNTCGIRIILESQN